MRHSFFVSAANRVRPLAEQRHVSLLVTGDQRTAVLGLRREIGNLSVPSIETSEVMMKKVLDDGLGSFFVELAELFVASKHCNILLNEGKPSESVGKLFKFLLIRSAETDKELTEEERRLIDRNGVRRLPTRV